MAEEKEIFADPMASLGVRTAKHVQNCKELHLGGKGITQLVDLEPFENIEVLWVNGNALRQLNGFDSNFRIKELYAHDNRIQSLRTSSLSALTFLRVLTLQGNCISDLHATLKVLRHSRHLVELDLQGNPVCEETNYRLHVVKSLPWLQLLDKHKIVDEERAKAAALKRRRSVRKRPSTAKSHPNLEASMVADPPDTSLVQQLPSQSKAMQGQSLTFAGTEVERRHGVGRRSSRPRRLPTEVQKQCSEALKEFVKSCRRRISEKRILLRPHFLEADRRRENAIRFATFLAVLDRYHMAPHETETDPKYGFNLRRLLLDAFGVAPPSRSVSLGRDKPVAEEPFIDYLSFCTATDPGALRGSRDLAERQLEAATDWKYPVDEFSESILALQLERVRRVRSEARTVEVRKRQLLEEEARQHELMLKKAGVKAPPATKESDFQVEEGHLTAWDVYSLKSLLAQAEKTSDGRIEEATLRRVISAMKHEVRKEAVLAIDRSADPGAEVNGWDALDLIFDSMKESPEQSTFSEATFVERVLQGLPGVVHQLPDGSTTTVDVPPLRWHPVRPEELKEIRASSYEGAVRLERQILASNAPPTELLPKVYTLVHRACRMEGAEKLRWPGRNSSRARGSTPMR